MNWSVYRYVQQYFQKNFPEWYLMKEEQKRGFTKIVDELLEGGTSLTDIKRGLHDELLNKKLNDFVNDYLTENERKDCLRLYEYIFNLVNDKPVISFKYNSDTVDSINKQILFELFPQYSESRLETSEFEQLVLGKYKEKCENLFKDIRNKIKLYLEKNLDYYQLINRNVNLNDLVNYITCQILIDNDYGTVLNVVKMKVVDSKNKNVIEQMIDTYTNRYIVLSNRKAPNKKVESNQNNAQNSKKVDPLNYIASLVMQNYEGVNNELLSSCVRVVYSRLTCRGYNVEQIVSDEMRNFVINFIDEFFTHRQARIDASKNSVINEKTPPRMKINRKRKQINKTIISLALVATLVSYGAVNVFSDIHDYNAKKNVSMIDDYYYANIHTIYAQPFQPTVDNIINTFDDYSQFGNENYQYLGFYQAYRSVKQDRLYIMDNMLSDIRRDVRNNGRCTDLANSIMFNSCYLDFIYDRLYDMGFEEIRDKRYQDLLDSYVSLKNEHPYENVVKYLSPSEQKLLEKVRDKYIELSEQCLVELGELLEQGNYVSLNGGGKNL